MPIVTTDLIAYVAANEPEDEVSASGGAIAPTIRAVFTDLAANDDVEAVSDDAADTTQQVTVFGRDATGAYVSETKTLTGTTPVVFSTISILERVEKVTMDSDALGNVTIQRSPGGATIGIIPPGERGFSRLFIKAFSDASPKDYYAKVFLKNANGSLSLLNATVSETADPTGKITFALATAVNDSEAPANRLTAPVSVSAFDNSDKAVPGTNLAAGSAIGVWLKLSLGALDAPIKSTYTTTLSGQSV